jgi:ribonuclease PH
MRAVVDLVALGERSVTVDCDVLQADGGTRTAAITGGYIALVDAIASSIPDAIDASGLPKPGGPLKDSVAAVSVGVVDGKVWLDLDYQLDSRADVDMNVVMTGKGRFIEIQGTGEEATFDEDQLQELLRFAKAGIVELTQRQQQALSN